MGKSWLLLAFILWQVIPNEAAIAVGGGVGIGIGNAGGVGGGGVWIGGGIGSNTPTPSVPSVSKLSSAYTALQAWKSAIADDPMRILETWVGSDVCSYKGVFCADPQGGVASESFVAGIDLNHANLQGTLVSELSVLTDISILHLNSNRFSGTVPDSFRELSSLQELDLSNNRLSGPFPTVTLYMPNLVYLDLRFNSFSGPVPQDLFNKGLDAIFLNDNQFEGEIPQNLGNSPASVINLANNKFTGTEDSQSMSTQGRIKHLKVIRLIDYASINFIDQSLIKRLGFHTWSVAGCSVTVAHGDKILDRDTCEAVKCGHEVHSKKTDFLVLVLMGCE